MSRALLVLGVVLFACGPSEAPPRREPGRPSKASLFADPGLVPTREGERVRRELAQAGELERLLADAGIKASVAVSLVEPASAVVVAHAAEPDLVRELASAALPAIEPMRIAVKTLPVLEAAQDEPARAPVGPALALALGLGLSLGIALERSLAGGRFARR